MFQWWWLVVMFLAGGFVGAIITFGIMTDSAKLYKDGRRGWDDE